ncbi:hypothetical protein Vafri_10612, partial [Volvox africanus]
PPAGGTLSQQDGAGGRGRRGPATAAAAPGAAAEAGGPASLDTSGTTGSVSERVQLPVQHILSDEMQRLLEQIKQILATAAGPAAGGGKGALWGELGEPAGASAAAASLVLTPMQRAILVTMQTDPGMQQLLPYLTKYVCDDVAAGLRHLPRLHMVLRVVQALLLNPSVHLEPYLHQLMPPLLTCCMAKALGPSPTCDHWRLRDSAAALVAQLCGRFGEPFYSLKVKVSKQLLRALLDGSKPLTSHYGAVVGLAALGHATVRLLLLPQLEPYLAKLQPALEARKEGVRQYEATRVYGALLTAAGAATYDKLVGTAADGLLPVHLFRAGRTRLNVPALAGSTTSPAQTQQQQQQQIITTVPLPHPNPELDALWEQLRIQNGGAGPLVQVFNVIVADPSAPTARSQLEQLRASAADTSQPSHKAAQALLYQLAKRGVGPPTTPPPQVPQGKVSGAVVSASIAGQRELRSQTSGGGGGGGGGSANATNSNADGGARTSAGAATIFKAGTSGSGGSTRSARAILAESWREDADPGEVVWALTEVLGPPFLAWLPQPPVLAAMNI